MFLLENWDRTSLASEWAIYSTSKDPEAGNQFPTDVGSVDILAVHSQISRTIPPRVIPERFGLVLAEANAAGVPVIAMDLGSCREVIKDGQMGFLVNNVNEAAQRAGCVAVEV